MNAHLLAQALAETVNTQRINFVAMKTLDGARNVIHPMVDQGYFRGLRIIAKQLDVDIRQARGRTTPDRAAKMWTESLHALHPGQGQLPKGQ